MSNNKKPVTYVKRPPELEYVMSKQMFDSIADTRADKNSNPYTYVMEEINSTFGLAGTVATIRFDG